MPIENSDINIEELLKIKWMFEEQQKIAKFGTWEWDIKENKSTWSEEAYRLYGLEPYSDLNYEEVARYRHPDDAKMMDVELKKAIINKKTYSVIYRIIRKDGEIRYIRGHGKVFCDDDGIPAKVFGTMQDITLQMTVEKRIIHEIHDRNRQILDSLNEGVGLFDSEGFLLSVNRHYADRFRMAKNELIGKNLKDLFPEEKYGDLYQIRMKKLRAVFETGKPNAFLDDRDGGYYFNRHYPVFKNGSVDAVTLISADITDKVLLEEKSLRASLLLKETKMLRSSNHNESSDFYLHELVKPLAAFYSDIALLKATMKNNSEDQQTNLNILEAIEKRLIQVSRLLHAFLDHSQENEENNTSSVFQ